MTNNRVQVTTAQSHGNLKGSTLNEKLAIEKRIKGKKRGPRGPRARRLDERRVVLGEGGIEQFNGDRYLKLQSGSLLPEVWQDVYEWFAGGVAPREWREGLCRTAPATFSESDRVKEKFSQLI